MKNLLRFVLTFSFALLASLASAVPPQTVNYQGDLTNTGGTPINAPVAMTFRLYNVSQGGAALYTEVQPSVAVSNGSFNAVIGAVTPITLPFDVPYWLSVQINADPEMAPRQPLASSPYAFRAATANSVTSVTGSQISGSITTATIPVANVIGAVAGPQGPVGATGPQGATGATGVAGPAGATGAQGLQGVTGATGAIGSAGQAGLDGNTVLSGSGVPAAALGVNGNFYINTAANNIHGPKAAGAWPAGVALVGPQGPIGTTGAVGAAGPTGATGTQGVQGVAGATGAAGAQGPIGVTGAQGPVGATGATGPAGPNNITGNLTMVNSTSSTVGNILKSGAPFIHNFGTNNTFLGLNAGNFTMGGGGNTAIGQTALVSNGTGGGNTATGSGALFTNSSGSNNTASGRDALRLNSSGAANTAVGRGALSSNIAGIFNTAIGESALASNTASNNTAIGQAALGNNTVGIQNTATGVGALLSNIDAGDNTAIGYRTLFSNSSGFATGNTAIGSTALMNNISGDSNVAIGVGALSNMTGGRFNIALGTGAGSNLTTGLSNIHIDHPGFAGESQTTRIGQSPQQTRAFLAGIRGVTPAVNDAFPVIIDSAGQLGTGGGSLTLTGSLNFGNVTRQMLNLWVTGPTQYAIGVQDLTFYQRTSGHFAWYDNGTHSNTALTPGAGGTTLMTLSSVALGTAVVGLARAQTFSSTSDRNVKEAFAAVDGAKILAALVRMPMQSWKYRNEEKVRHIGPTAQDFRAAFGVGYDDKTIATVDADGVAMAAIQGLNAKVGKQLAAKDAVIKSQSARLEILERELRSIKAMLGAK